MPTASWGSWVVQMLPERESRPTATNGDPASVSVATKNKPIVRRAAVLVDEDTITIKGPAIFETLRPARLRPIYVGGQLGGWVLDRRRLPDVLAALDAAGYVVRIVEAGEVR